MILHRDINMQGLMCRITTALWLSGYGGLIKYSKLTKLRGTDQSVVVRTADSDTDLAMQI